MADAKRKCPYWLFFHHTRIFVNPPKPPPYTVTPVTTRCAAWCVRFCKGTEWHIFVLCVAPSILYLYYNNHSTTLYKMCTARAREPENQAPPFTRRIWSGEVFLVVFHPPPSPPSPPNTTQPPSVGAREPTPSPSTKIAHKRADKTSRNV